MMILVITMISVPAFADDDNDRNERDDDRDNDRDERHDERDDNDRDEIESSHDEIESSHDEIESSHDESNESVFDEIGERLSGQSEENERHDEGGELHSQHIKQMTVLQDRVVFLEKQIEGKDSIISEQMKVIMMLVERINQVIFDQIMMPAFGI